MDCSIHKKVLEAVSPFEHVIWDWNGTLIDDTQIAVDSVNVMLIENGLTPLDIPRYREYFGFPIRSYYEKVGFDLEKLDFTALCHRFVEEYNIKRSKSARLFRGIPEVLTDIKKTKTQSILSAAEQNHLHEMTDHYGIASFFHNRFGIEDYFARSKESRGHQLMQQVGITKEKTILIGDTDHDFEVACAMGVSCLLIADGHQSYDRLKNLGTTVISGRIS